MVNDKRRPSQLSADDSSRYIKEAVARRSPPPPTSDPSFIVGNSPQMLEVFDRIRRFAPYELPVLITGESGTGKELVAKAIHERSGRASGPFVAVNCAGMPATLIASELFGYEKGAFTGALARKRGLVEQAANGTLLLDEIGDMPFDLQGHLLRFLQEEEIVRVGGHEPVKVSVRVIAATNVKMADAVAAGRLREDLFYRLNVLSLHLPPLRLRAGDIPILVNYFLETIARELHRPKPQISPLAVAALEAHRWPGNIRELIATLRRAIVLCNDDLIETGDLGMEFAEAPSSQPIKLMPDRPRPGSEEERALLLDTLGDHGWNITRCAQVLNVSRVTLYRMLERQGLNVSDEGKSPGLARGRTGMRPAPMGLTTRAEGKPSYPLLRPDGI
ncbi:MAG TPA: sigma-54 dependent transcriptional regulator [Stellaceae bacterium]|nr:sigma-54 dependent transcriptional regulator [Stellaceae bacterium]